MKTGEELDRLLARIVSIYTQEAEHEAPAADEPTAPFSCSPQLDEPAEELIATVLTALRRIAAATQRHSTLPPAPPSALRGALGGADLVMRAEFLSGRGEQIPSLLPSFTYLATIPFLDRAEALRRSDRVRELLEAEGCPPA